MGAVLEPIFEGGGFPMQAPGRVPGGTGPTGTGEGSGLRKQEVLYLKGASPL